MKTKTCRVCNKGALRDSKTIEKYYPNKRLVEVELVESRCEECEAVYVSASQHSENLLRLAARKSEYGDQLLGEEFVAFRKRYGLTQRQASKIFGKGLIAFSRYENEETYPDTSTRLLIELAIAQPQVLKTLADKAGVEIPLWKERSEDEQQAERQATLAQVESARDVVNQIHKQVESDRFEISIIRANEYMYGTMKSDTAVHKVSSIEPALMRLDENWEPWIKCTAGLELLAGVGSFPNERLRQLHYDTSYSPFGNIGAVGDDIGSEMALGGPA